MLILDAANLLHAAHGMAWPMSELDRGGLVRLVSSQRLSKRGAEVVFDGVRPEDPAGLGLGDDPDGLVRLRWSGRGREADDLIEELIAIDSAPKRLLVVSSDRRIRAAARRAGATSETSRDFLARAYRAMLDRAHRLPAPKVREEVPLGRDTLRSWLREFGFDPALADRVPDRVPDRDARASSDDQRAAIPNRRPTGKRPGPDGLAGDEHGASGKAAALPPVPSTPRRPRKSPVVIDDELAALIKEWGGGIQPADLDMQTWIGPNAQHADSPPAD